MRRLPLLLAASILCTAPPAAMAGNGVPSGSVGVSYDCENLSGSDFATGGANAASGILYDFADGPGGNAAQTSLGYTSWLTSTLTLDNRSSILLPGAATTADCLVGGSLSVSQPMTITGNVSRGITVTVPVRIDVVLNGWTAQVPTGAPAGTDTSMAFQVGIGGNLLSENFILDPAGLNIANQPGAWTVDPMAGGAVSVSGTVAITDTVPTATPFILDLFADQFAFVPTTTVGISVTNTLPPNAVLFQVTSLEPGTGVQSLGIAPPPVDEPQTGPQQKCLTGLNKAAAKVVQAQLKLNEKCVKDAIKGKESSAQACVQIDPKGKVVKAAQKAMAVDAKKCQDKPEQLPSFSYVPASIFYVGAKGEGILYLEDLLGADADMALADEKSETRCQTGVLKSADKYVLGLIKEAIKAKKEALKNGASSPAALESAILAALSSSNKLPKLEGKLGATGDKKCGDVADLGQIFPGTLAIGVTPQSVTDEAARAARCRACLVLNQVDALTLDCDTLDDATPNATCP